MSTDRGSRRKERGCVHSCRRRSTAIHGEVEDGSVEDGGPGLGCLEGLGVSSGCQGWMQQ